MGPGERKIKREFVHNRIEQWIKKLEKTPPFNEVFSNHPAAIDIIYHYAAHIDDIHFRMIFTGSQYSSSISVQFHFEKQINKERLVQFDSFIRYIQYVDASDFSKFVADLKIFIAAITQVSENIKK